MSGTKKLKYACELYLSGADFSEYQSENCDVWRFLFDDINDERNFQPTYFLEESTFLKHFAADALMPSGFGLSVFDTQENLKKQFDRLKLRSRKIGKLIGDNSGRGSIEIKDGIISSVNGRGHRDLHPFEDCNLPLCFEITEKLL